MEKYCRTCRGCILNVDTQKRTFCFPLNMDIEEVLQNKQPLCLGLYWQRRDIKHDKNFWPDIESWPETP